MKDLEDRGVSRVEAIFVGIHIPIRNGQLFPPFAVPLRLPYLIAVLVIQSQVVKWTLVSTRTGYFVRTGLRTWNCGKIPVRSAATIRSAL